MGGNFSVPGCPGCWRRSSCSGSISAGPAGNGRFFGCRGASVGEVHQVNGERSNNRWATQMGHVVPDCSEYSPRPETSRAPHHFFPKAFHDLRHTTILAMPVSSSSVMNTDAPWRCPDAAAPAPRRRNGHIACRVHEQTPGQAMMTPSLANIGRKNSIGWPFSDRPDGSDRSANHLFPAAASAAIPAHSRPAVSARGGNFEQRQPARHPGRRRTAQKGPRGDQADGGETQSASANRIRRAALEVRCVAGEIFQRKDKGDGVFRAATMRSPSRRFFST